jgi:hypothetical protein
VLYSAYHHSLLLSGVHYIAYISAPLAFPEEGRSPAKFNPIFSPCICYNHGMKYLTIEKWQHGLLMLEEVIV